MKIRTLKKNNPILRSRRDGKGFYGRVFVMGVDDKFIVLQNDPKGAGRKAPKTTAVLTYCDVDLFEKANEYELVVHAVQRHYLKKYGHELLLMRSFVSLQGFTEVGKVFELSLEPVGGQLELEYQNL